MSVAFAPAWHQVAHRPRIVIVDDHPLVVEALMARLERTPSGAALHYAGASVFQAVHVARTQGCDCAIVDVDLGGPTRASEVVTAFSMHDIAVVALAERASVEGMEAALIAGASAYVDKCGDPRRITEAVDAAISGGTWVPPELSRRHGAQAATLALSAQEQRSLVLYASGMTLDTVARRMGIAPSTVKHYLDRVRHKCADAGFEARTKLELHAVARSQGLLP